MRYFLTCSCIIFASLVCQAQSRERIDSLKNIISHGIDSSVIQAYVMWGEEVYLQHADSALSLFEDAVTLARLMLEENDESNQYRISLTKSLSMAINNIGYMHRIRGNIIEALEYYQESLRLDREIGNKSGEGTSLNNLAIIHRMQGDYDKALEYFLASLELSKESDRATTLNNIGLVYFYKKQYDESLNYFEPSYKLRLASKNKQALGVLLVNMALAYERRANEEGMVNGPLIDTCMVYLNRSLAIREELNDRNGISHSLTNIARMMILQGKINEALPIALASMKIAEEIGYPRTISAAADKLVMIYRRQKKWKETLEMKELYVSMNDSVKNTSTQKAAIRQQTQHEFEKEQMIRDQEAKDQQRHEREKMARRDNLQFSVIFIAILILFGGVMSLGFINVNERMAEGLIFFSYLILFEFFLVLADPYIDTWSGGAPGVKLLFNAGIAALIFPLHSFFEIWLKRRIS